MRRYVGQTAETRRVVSAHMAKTAYSSSVDELVRVDLAGRVPDVPVSMTSSGTSVTDTLIPAPASRSRKRKRMT